MPQEYPEIHALEDMLKKHSFSIEFLKDDFPFCALCHQWVRFRLNDNIFILMIDDEYKDFELNIPTMNLCLVLRELEDYQEEEDILKWCNLKGLKVSDVGVLEYYKGLDAVYKEVKKTLGTIDSHISNYDFEMSAGAAQALRRN